MSPFHIEPRESRRCWYPYLCFNKPLPASLVSPELRSQVVAKGGSRRRTAGLAYPKGAEVVEVCDRRTKAYG